MRFTILKIFSVFIFIGAASVYAQAQIDASTPSGRPRQQEELPVGIQETLKKQEIERIKKDHEELLEYGEEAALLSEEVAETFEKTNRLSGKDLEKVEKIEKLVKKIRGRLGGDDDDKQASEITNQKASLNSVIQNLRETTENLLDQLKKTSRYSISVVAIQSSNTLLDIVRLLKFWKK